MLCGVVIALSCSKDDLPTPTPCADVEVTAHAGAVQSDGSVTVYGSVGTSSNDAGITFPELTVYSVYVAETAATGSGFNFQAWSVDVDADRLAAFAGSNGSAELPVVVFLSGVCVQQGAIVEVPAGSGSGSDTGSGSDAGSGSGSGS